jgi:AcrR family transcriptional regulator
MKDDKERRILTAAFDVFLRYGYRRATMDDIARATAMSRPALYLVFPSKEAIFREVVETGLDEMLRDIEAGLGAHASLEGRLGHVFEIWSVRTFETVARSPDARELMASSFEFVDDVFERHGQRLAKLLADLIRAAVAEPDALSPSAQARARLLMASAHGFKTMARDAQDLRDLVRDLVRVTVAALPTPSIARRARPKRARPRPTGVG